MKIIPPHNVRVVDKCFTVKLGPVVPEFQCIFREAKSQKYLSMKTAVGAMQPAKMLTMMRKANLSIMIVIGLNEDEEGLRPRRRVVGKEAEHIGERGPTHTQQHLDWCQTCTIFGFPSTMINRRAAQAW